MASGKPYVWLLAGVLFLSSCQAPTAIPSAALPATANPTSPPPAATLPPPAPTETLSPPLLPTSTEVPPTLPPTEIPQPTSTAPSLLPPGFDAGLLVQSARQHLLALTEEIGARLPGSEEEAQAAAYIQTELQRYGYETRLQSFSFYDEEEDDYFPSANVIAVKPGQSSQVIVVGAHYDSVDEALGADDNASGVAVMLAVAEQIRKVSTPYTVHFVAFGAEEVDLDGSRYFVSRLKPEERKNVVAMFNLDSLIAGDLDYIYGDSGSPSSLRDWVLRIAPQVGFSLEGKLASEMDNEDGSLCECADYGPFQEAGIPFAYFEATNWNLGDEDGTTQVDPQYGEAGLIRHTEYDSLEVIDQLFPGRVDQHLELFSTLLYLTLVQFDL